MHTYIHTYTHTHTYIHIHSTDPVSASTASEYGTCQLINDESEMLVYAKKPISVL